MSNPNIDISSNLIRITSGQIPTTSTLPIGHLAFGLVFETIAEPGRYRLFGNSDNTIVEYTKVYSTNDNRIFVHNPNGDDIELAAMPPGAMSRRQLEQGTDFDISFDVVNQEFDIVSQNLNASIWSSFWWGISTSETQSTSSSTWAHSNMGSNVRAPRSFSLLTGVALHYTSSLGAGELGASNIVIDPDDPRKVQLTFDIGNFAEAVINLNFIDWGGSPGDQGLSFNISATAHQDNWSQQVSSFSLNITNIELQFNSGTETVPNYIALIVDYNDSFNIMEEVLVDVELDMDMGDGITPFPVYMRMSFDSKKALPQILVNMSIRGDEGFWSSGTPNGNIVEIHNEIIPAKQLWVNNTDSIYIDTTKFVKFPLDGNVPQINNITVINAIKTQVNDGGNIPITDNLRAYVDGVLRDIVTMMEGIGGS